MSDPAFHLLQHHLSRHREPALWIADESALAAAKQLSSARSGLSALSNRVDVHEALEAAGIHSYFNDFASDTFADASLQQIFYRVSKEKPIAHHVINLAARWLAVGGELILCGLKNEGTKTYIEKTGELFGEKIRPQKNGQIYQAQIRKTLALSEHSPWLDDSDYTRIRPVAEQDGLVMHSKPGVFGWNKIDRGSALLIDTLTTWLPADTGDLTLLDLGCGYGYLSLMASRFPFQRRIATDNNAGALACIAAGATHNQLAIDIIAADCGNTITDPVDIIVCNPPFHQGFNIDGDLTDKFLQQTRRLLRKGGKALFVVNQFIPLEKKAAPLFAAANPLLEQDGFKLVELVR